MSIDRDKAALQMFEAALEVAPAERSSWIHGACGEDPALVAEVCTLLSAHEETSDFLDNGPKATKIFDAMESLRALHIVAGQRLGDFVIERQIGAGGMGVVYRARQISLNRLVALKVLPPHLRYSENAQIRFQREVEAAARLSHPNIVAVYTTGDDNGAIYYAMELIDGPSLSDLVEKLKRQPIPELQNCEINHVAIDQSQASTRAKAGDATPAPSDIVAKDFDLSVFDNDQGYFRTVAALITDVAAGLQYAHEMKVIHRDIKPSNLLLSSEGEIHISDFGLARIAHEPGLTRTGEVIGTPYYMAPEQIFPKMGSVDARTDVYALGATLYELLTLRPPFCGEQREQVISQIAHNEPLLPKSLNRLVPLDLETICLKAIEKSPARRYQSAQELADDLRRYTEGRPILARAITPLARGVRWVQRHRTWTTAIGAMCILAVVALFFAYRTYRSEARWTDAQFTQLFETAQLAALEGNVKRADAAIDEAEKLGATGAQVTLLRGQLDLRTGEFQNACDKLAKVVEEMPDSVAAHALLATAYQLNEEHDKSARISQLLPTLKPVTLQDYLLLGQAEFGSDFAKGLATLDKAVQLDKTSVQARLTRGSLLAERAMDTGDAEIAERALADLKIARELFEPNAYILVNILKASMIAATAHELGGNKASRDQHLAEAHKIAEELRKSPDRFPSHLWRGIYFEYLGDDEQALNEWKAIEERQIAYMVLNLMRSGQIGEALHACDDRLARIPYARSTQFFRGVLTSVKADSPEEVVTCFEPPGEETLDRLNLHRFNYWIQCLAGNLPRAQELSCEFRETPYGRSPKDPWRHHLVDFTCGDIDGDELIKRSASSRIALCQAHFFVAMSHLATGDRPRAREHFLTAANLRIVGYDENALSRTLIVQLDRDPQWPKWISEN